MRVGVENGHGLRRELGNEITDAGDAEPGIEKQGTASANDQVGDDFFELVRFVNGVDVWSYAIDLEPAAGDVAALEALVLGARQLATPIGTQRLCRLLRDSRCKQEPNE